MFLTRVTMTNYMRYENETVELAPGFNTISGPTDAGKSTLIRALVWVFYARPLGLEMIRDGADEARVEIEINRGTIEAPDLHTIVRLRSKKRNAYIIDGQEFDNVKTDVPEEARALTGVVTAEIGPKVFVELNVSRQMDGLFMLTGSGGDAAKIMGNLAGITTLDTGLSSIKPDLSAVTKALAGIEKMEENYAASIGEFESLDADGARIATAGDRIKVAQVLDQRLTSLRAVSARMADYNVLVTTIDADIAAAASRASVAGRVATARTTFNRLESLKDLGRKMAALNIAWTANERQAKAIDVQALELHTTYQTILHDAGTCPTCGAQQP